MSQFLPTPSALEASNTLKNLALANMQCHKCGTPFPIEARESVPSPIQGTWECQPCSTVARDQLIEQLKEKNRVK